MLPESLIEPLQQHLQKVRRLHQQDLDQGYGSVYLPFALERRYPNADLAWIWQFVFPSFGRSRDPRTGIVRRHHLHETGIQRSLKKAVAIAKIEKGLPQFTSRRFIPCANINTHHLTRISIKRLVVHKRP